MWNCLCSVIVLCGMMMMMMMKMKKKMMMMTLGLIGEHDNNVPLRLISFSFFV